MQKALYSMTFYLFISKCKWPGLTR